MNFFVSTGNNFARLFEIPIGMKMISIAAPIGISYYTLAIVGYVIDVYREEYLPQKNLAKFALFACYFPQMISGPVTRYGEMSHQLYSGASFSYTNLVHGLQRMAWGYMKKLVVADRLGILVRTVYGNMEVYSGMYLFIATVAYAFQLYADFSGCMDIVLGASLCFGIELPENFRAPFFSTSIGEFWRRWHISLGVWFKDYFMYPLLKSRAIQKLIKTCKTKFGAKTGKNVGTYLGLTLLWVTIGLWHGGTYKYIFASGVIPCFYLVGSELVQPQFEKINRLFHINTKCFSFHLFQSMRTLLLMCVCWVFVCSQSFTQALVAFKLMFTGGHFEALRLSNLLSLGLGKMDFLLVALGLLGMLFVDVFENKKMSVQTWFDSQNIVFRYLALWALALTIMLFGLFGSSSFIYFQF